MRHTISVLVENKFGVLARIATLFAARGFNIDSLAVGETEDPLISRMTIVVSGDDRTLEQVEKQLNKLIDVIKVNDFKGIQHIESGIALIKVNVNKANRPEIVRIAEMFQAKISDVATDSIIVEISGDEQKIQSIINMLKPFGLKEMCRTGIIAMACGIKDSV
ncbi:MAG: acetolactate synthase small subunit [Elusimicrobia bacterium]|nr:acetolactate synthase small subunit [Elusimicrobiota bacterium]